MKRTLIRLVACLLCAVMLGLALVGCADGTDDVPENMQPATVQGSLYRLYVPQDWNLMLDMGMSGAYASLQTTAVVFVRDYDALGMSTADYAQSVHAPLLAAAFPEHDAQLSAPTATVLDGQAAVYVDYKGTRDKVTYLGRDVVCVRDGRAYVLSFSAQMDVYEGYVSIRDEITTAFRFSAEAYEPKDAVNTVDPTAPAPAGMMLASNDDVAYRFYVPDTWVLDTALPTSSAYVSEDDRSGVTVTVRMPEVDQMTAEQYWEQASGEILAVCPDMTVLSITQTTLDTRPAHTYIYTATVGEHLYRFAQTVAAYRGMVYTVTYTALDERFDEHWSQYADILSAFDFRGNE